MNMFGWCMWQTMHWLVGIARVNAWRQRMARLVLAGWSGPLVCVSALVAEAAHRMPEWRGSRSLA